MLRTYSVALSLSPPQLLLWCIELLNYIAMLTAACLFVCLPACVLVCIKCVFLTQHLRVCVLYSTQLSNPFDCVNSFFDKGKQTHLLTHTRTLKIKAFNVDSSVIGVVSVVDACYSYTP